MGSAASSSTLPSTSASASAAHASVASTSSTVEAALQGPGAAPTPAKPSALTRLKPAHWLLGIQNGTKDTAIDEAKRLLSAAIQQDIRNKSFVPANLVEVFQILQHTVDNDFEADASCAQALIDAVFAQAVDTIKSGQIDKLEPFVDALLAVPSCARTAIAYAERAIRAQVRSLWNLRFDSVSIRRVRENQLGALENGVFALHVCNLFRLADKPSQQQINNARNKLQDPNYTASSCGQLVVDCLKKISMQLSDLEQVNAHPASLLLNEITGFVFHAARNHAQHLDSNANPANFHNLPGVITQKYFNSLVAKKDVDFVRDSFRKSKDPCYEGTIEHLLGVSPFGQTRVVFHPRPEWNVDWGEDNIGVLVDWAIRGMLENYARTTNLPLVSMSDQHIEDVLSASPNFARFVVSSKDKILACIFDDNHKPNLLEYENDIKAVLDTELNSMVSSAEQALQGQVDQKGAYVRVVRSGIPMASELERYKNPDRPSPCTHLLAWGEFHTSEEVPPALVFAPSAQVVLGGKNNINSDVLGPRGANLVGQFTDQQGVVNYRAYGNYLALFFSEKFVVNSEVISRKIAEQYARASRFSPNPQPLLNASSKWLVQRILQFYGRSISSCTAQDINECLQLFIDQFPKYKPQALAALGGFNKNPDQFLQKVQSNLPAPKLNKYSKQLPHNEVLALPNLDNVIGLAIRTLDTTNIARVLTQLANLKVEYAKLNLTWVDFDVYLHTWCNNSQTHLVCLKPEALACWTFDTLVQFIQAPAGAQQTMAWDCSMHFRAVHTLMLHTVNNKAKGYALVSLSTIPDDVVQQHTINTNNLIELLLQSVRNRLLEFATIQPFVHMLAASNVAITDAVLQLAGQVYPDNLEAKNFLQQLMITPPGAIVDGWVQDRLTALAETHPEFALNAITLRRANGMAETGRGAYIPAERLFRVMEGIYTVSEHPGLRFEGTAQYNPDLNRVATNHQQGQGCLLEKTDKATYRYLYLNNSNPRPSVPSLGVQIQTQSLFRGRQLRYFCTQQKHSLVASSVQLVFLYQPNQESHQESPWRFQVFLDGFHGQRLHTIQNPTPAFEFSLDAEVGPWLEEIPNPENFVNQLVHLKESDPNAINWLLPPMLEQLAGSESWEPVHTMAYQLARLGYLQGCIANVPSGEQGKHEQLQGLVQDLMAQIKSLVAQQNSIQELLPDVSPSDPEASLNGVECLKALKFSTESAPTRFNLKDLLQFIDGADQIFAAKDLKIPVHAGGSWQTECRLRQFKKQLDNGTFDVNQLKDLSIYDLLRFLAVVPKNLQSSLGKQVVRTPDFFKRFAKEVKHSETPNRLDSSALLAAFNLVSEHLHTRPTHWSKPKLQHYTKVGCFAGILAAKIFACGVTELADIADFLPNFEDLANLPEHLAAAKQDLLEAQNNASEKVSQFVDTYGYKGGPEYDAYVASSENLLEQAKQDPALQRYLAYKRYSAWPNLESLEDRLQRTVANKDSPWFTRRGDVYDADLSGSQSFANKASNDAFADYIAAADRFRASGNFPQTVDYNGTVIYGPRPFDLVVALRPDADYNRAKSVGYDLIEEPMKELARAQKNVDSLQEQRVFLQDAQGPVATAYLGTEGASAGAALHEHSSNPPQMQRTWLGKIAAFKAKWVGPTGAVGLLFKLPSLCTALRSQRSKLVHVSSLLLGRLANSTLTANQKSQTMQTALDRLQWFQEENIPKYLQSAYFKEAVAVFLQPTEVPGVAAPEGAAGLDEQPAELVGVGLRLHKYHALVQLEGSLNTLPAGHKFLAGAKSAWCLFKFTVNRLVRYTYVVPKLISWVMPLFYKTYAFQAYGLYTRHLDARAAHLKTKGLTVLAGLFQRSANSTPANSSATTRAGAVELVPMAP